jgi:hypothetical protein
LDVCLVHFYDTDILLHAESLIPKAIPHWCSLQHQPHLCSTAHLDTSNPKVSGADVLPAELRQWWIEDGKGLINLANATMFGVPKS